MTLDLQLWERLKSGNHDALRQVMRENGPRVLRHARSILGSAADADDVFQEVFIRVFRFAGSYQGGSFPAWLHKITKNCCMNVLENRRRQTAHEDAFRTTREHRPEANPATELDLAPLLRMIPASDREILHLKVVEQLSYREIAEVTGFSEGTLRNTVCKSLKLLREESRNHELP